MALSALPPEKQPSACLKYRSCEQVCPQQIKISEVLAEFSEKLRKKTNAFRQEKQGTTKIDLKGVLKQ